MFAITVDVVLHNFVSVAEHTVHKCLPLEFGRQL